ncbi:hypothetical protein JQC91_03340 [Jannaschia sp. Os4]|uniref:hypothetical protein n=1 Tax=Jannaschia sp. Os4 TaxID=2807617 RepID=UPI0019398352|nr:hypothetical protein [Jannaschia sp. Os4]MBM2575329.1 hypothetical protein [Jannaschia sp. Os4]
MSNSDPRVGHSGQAAYSFLKARAKAFRSSAVTPPSDVTIYPASLSRGADLTSARRSPGWRLVPRAAVHLVGAGAQAFGQASQHRFRCGSLPGAVGQPGEQIPTAASRRPRYGVGAAFAIGKVDLEGDGEACGEDACPGPGKYVVQGSGFSRYSKIARAGATFHGQAPRTKAASAFGVRLRSKGRGLDELCCAFTVPILEFDQRLVRLLQGRLHIQLRK